MENGSSTRRIHVFYRHIHAGLEANSRAPNKVRPSWFTYEACFRNLLTTIRDDPNGERVSVTLMFDGGWEQFISDFSAIYCANRNYGVNYQLLTAGSDKNSALITLNFAYSSDSPDGDLFYILENDYMHKPGWVSKVFEIYNSNIGFDYLSLYDHEDKYILPRYDDLTSRIFYTNSHHWRTVPSSCGSFICSYDRLRSDKEIWCHGMPDYYYYEALRELKDCVLLTPIPGLATHCMAGYLSPTIDWGSLV